MTLKIEFGKKARFQSNSIAQIASAFYALNVGNLITKIKLD